MRVMIMLRLRSFLQGEEQVSAAETSGLAICCLLLLPVLLSTVGGPVHSPRPLCPEGIAVWESAFAWLRDGLVHADRHGAAAAWPRKFAVMLNAAEGSDFKWIFTLRWAVFVTLFGTAVVTAGVSDTQHAFQGGCTARLERLWRANCTTPGSVHVGRSCWGAMQSGLCP